MLEGGFMDLKKSLVLALLCLAILSAGARAGSNRQVRPLEPKWLRQMYAEGWQKVQKGVLRKVTIGGKIETFGYGAEGLRWVARRYEQRVASLKSRYDASPSEDLAELIDQLEDQILRLEGSIDSAPSAESFHGKVLACTPLYSADALAGPQIGIQGVTASAKAYFHNDCGILGDTFTTANAQATAATGATSVTHNDPRQGAWIDSYSSASANGSTACSSWAEGSVTLDGNMIYHAFQENSNCDPIDNTST